MKFAVFAALALLPVYAFADGPYQLTTPECELSWDPSQSEEKGEVDGYTVYMVSMDPYSQSMVDVGLVNKALCSAVDAAIGIKIMATVRAYNSYGESPDSNVVSFIIVTDPPAPPPVVKKQGLMTIEECKIAWDPSPNQAADTVAGYILSVAQEPTFAEPSVTDVGLVNSVSCASVGAVVGKNYVRVIAYNPAGQSALTEAFEFVIVDAPPLAAVALKVAP